MKIGNLTAILPIPSPLDVSVLTLCIYCPFLSDFKATFMINSIAHCYFGPDGEKDRG